MVTLTIDDKQVQVPKDATIYDAAKAAGIVIPILCHDKKLHPFGGCRMCLVEVEQMKGRQIPACTTPVTEGMIVRTTSDEIIKARKMVLELLLLKHPIDCPVCDAAGDCDLQNLTFEYGVNKNRFSDEKFQHQIDYVNPLIERDMNRCIHCGKCARICDEVVSYGAFSFINRGIEAKMGTEFDGPLDCEFCGSCVSVCPVGALLSRPFKFKARWWALDKVKSVCSYCGSGCNVTLGVKDNKVLTTVYNEDQGWNKGLLCVRGRFGYQFSNSDKRLTTPLVRKNGQLVEASWDEALTLVADKLKAAGSAAAALVSPRLTNEELFLSRTLFKDALKSDNIDHSAGYGHAALSAGAAESLGQAASSATIGDITKSAFLLVVKSDAYETHPVIGYEVNRAVKDHSAALTIVSDKKGKLGKLPKALTLLHRPGAEVVLFNALAKVLVDENLLASSASSLAGLEQLKQSLANYGADKAAEMTGLTADAIRQLARSYAAAETALIMLPIGLAYPGHSKELAQAACNLALLAGKVGREGSGLLIMAEKNNSQGAVDLSIFPTAGGKNAAAIMEGSQNGSIQALYILGENPVVAYPDRKKIEAALAKVPFLVVQDLFLTETAAKAHVVLPAVSYAEKSGTFTSTERRLQKINRAMAPVGKSRSDFEILNDLLAKLGKSTYASVAEAFAALTKVVPAYAGLTLGAIADEGKLVAGPLSPKLVPVTGSVTAVEGGKFALVTGSALYHNGTLSRFGEGTTAVSPEGYLELGKEDAASLGIVDGVRLKVTSASGEVTLPAKVSNRLPKGVVFAPYHFGGQSINTVAVGAAVTPVSISK